MARLKELQHDLDHRVGARERTNLTLVMAAIVIGVGLFVSRNTSSSTIRPRDFVMIGVGMVLLTTVLIGISWRRVAINAIGRRILLLGGLSSVVLLVHRLVAWVADDRPSDILATDSLLFAAMCVVAAVTIDAKVAYVVAFPVAGAFASVAFPAHAAAAFSASTVALLVAAAVYFNGLSQKDDP